MVTEKLMAGIITLSILSSVLLLELSRKDSPIPKPISNECLGL